MSMTHDEMIAVIQAHKDGKMIECRDVDHIQGEPFEWLPSQSCWNFGLYDYRVKPEPPKPREWDLRCEHVYEVGGAGSINALSNVGNVPIRVREVLEENSVLSA